MSIFTAFADLAEKLFADFEAATGTLQSNTVTYNPTTRRTENTVVNYPVKLFLKQATLAQASNVEGINLGDLGAVILGKGLPVEPTYGDKLVVGSKTYDVISSIRVNPNNTVNIIFSVQLK